MFRAPTLRLAALGLYALVAAGCQQHGHDHDHGDHSHEHGDHDHDHDHDDHDHSHDDHDHDDDGDTAMAPATSSFYTLTTQSLAGDDMPLGQFDGQVALVVNVASKCGYTKQYAGLQSLHEEFADEGFTVIGVPSNDFGGQEPGSPDEIQEFCSTTYGVTFPMTHKVQTKSGAGQSPIYAHMNDATGELPSWNFGKYLVARDGTVVQYFESGVAPDDEVLRAAIRTELGKS